MTTVHVGGVEEAVVERQLQQLLVGRLGQLLAAVAHVDAPQARHAIEDLFALTVPDVDAVATNHDAGAHAGQRLVVGERMQEVTAVLALQKLRAIKMVL